MSGVVIYLLLTTYCEWLLVWRFGVTEQLKLWLLKGGVALCGHRCSWQDADDALGGAKQVDLEGLIGEGRRRRLCHPMFCVGLLW